jgi:predicted O-methyltransferase YrrM
MEKNVKSHHNVEDVAKRLSEAGINANLIQGNTRITLPAHEGEYDFAFIDGGHSVETIRSDWENVKRLMKPGGVVVFDDYYEGMPEEDLKKWGANEVVKDLEHTLSGAKDPVVGGGVTRLAIVQV